MVDDRLVILPVAKSTEIMFINQTIFDRFSQATGVTIEDLDTWEGLYKAAEIYAEWTDRQSHHSLWIGNEEVRQLRCSRLPIGGCKHQFVNGIGVGH